MASPMERLRGSKYERPVAEFGEQVLYMPLGDRPAFPEPRFLEGTWLGMDLRSGEVIIGTKSGVVRARTIKRRLEDVRWDAEEALAIKGTPWDPGIQLLESIQISFRPQSGGRQPQKEK